MVCSEATQAPILLDEFAVSVTSRAGRPSNNPVHHGTRAPAPIEEKTMIAVPVPVLAVSLVSCAGGESESAEEPADAGLSVDLFSSSQLGPDTERFVGVLNCDIDIDLQVFLDKAEAHFLDYFTGEGLELNKSIRAEQELSNS